MITLSVLYAKTAESHFDIDYYLTKHIPMVKDRLAAFELKDMRLNRGTTMMDDTTPAKFELIALLTFPSAQQIHAGLAAHGEEILGDIPMFTNIQPVIQMNEVL